MSDHTRMAQVENFTSYFQYHRHSYDGVFNYGKTWTNCVLISFSLKRVFEREDGSCFKNVVSLLAFRFILTSTVLVNKAVLAVYS